MKYAAIAFLVFFFVAFMMGLKFYFFNKWVTEKTDRIYEEELKRRRRNGIN